MINYKTSTPSFIDPKINTLTYLKSLGRVTGKMAKSMQEEIARSGGSVGLTLAYPFTKKETITDEELGPWATKFKHLIFGERPLRSLQTRIAESELKLKREGFQVPFTGKTFTPEQVGGKRALPLSVIGIGAMVALDFTGTGGSKNTLKLLTKLDNVGDISKVLKAINVADDLVVPYAKRIAKLNKVDDVAKAINKISDIQKTTKVAGQAAKISTKTRTRSFLRTVKSTKPNVPIRVSGQYIPRSTDKLAVEARTIIKTNIKKAEGLARVGTDDKAIATAAELIKHYSDEAVKTTDKAVEVALYEKASNIAHTTAYNLTEQGRSIQAASIMGRLTPEGFIRFAAKEINKYNDTVNIASRKIPSLTVKQTKYILKEAKKINSMTDGVEKAMAFSKLNTHITELVPTPLFKKLINIWKAGLLTGIRTSGLNTFSNLSHGTSEIIKDIPATAADSIMSLFTGKRTLAFATKGSLKGVKEGTKKGWRYLTTGFDERHIAAKLDYTKVNFGKGKVAKAFQRYEETIFRIMGAEDQPFYYGAKARSIANQSLAAAKNKGLKGRAAREFAEKLMKNPTDDIIKFASADAEIAVFQNLTELGKVARGIQKFGGGAGEIIVPFGRTPASVATQLFNYTPAGPVKEILKQIYKGKFDQRLLSQAIGRGVTGTGVIYIGSKLFKKGLMTLEYPRTEKERELWKIEGRIPNAIKIGGKYRNIAVLGPAGMTLLVGGYYEKALQESGSHIAALKEASIGGGKSLSEQSFVSGLNSFVDAITDPERSAELYAANVIGSLIPTIVGDIAKAKDPYERVAPGVLGRVKSKIPFLREKLEPQIGVLGTEIPRKAGPIASMIDPSRPSTILTAPVIIELRRLANKGHNVTPSKLGDKYGYETLTPEQNTALWEKAGELLNGKLENLIQTETYSNLSDEERAKIISGFTSKAYLITRTLAVMDLTDRLAGEELKNKLSLFKGNLMTKSVFKELIKLR